VEVLRALVEAGADVNKGNNNGRTPLIYAAGNGKVEVVRFLLQKGADKSLKDNDGDTALKLAKMFKHTAIVQLLQ